MRNKIQQIASDIIIENNWKQSIIIVAPRVGKTKLVIDALKKDNIDTTGVLIVAPYKTIIESWKKEFSMWNLDFKGKLTTNTSLSKCDPNKYKYVIVDEIQELSPNNIKDLKSYKNVIGLTGTLSSDNRQTLQRELKMTVQYEYTIEQAITDKIIADYKIHIYYLKLNDTDKVIDISPKGGSKPLVTEQFAYDYYSKQFEKMKYAAQFNPALHIVKQQYAAMRARLIYNLPTKLKVARQLINTINDKLIVFTQSQGISDNICDSYHSGNKDLDNLDKFIKGDITKLAVVNLVSMGITIPNLKKALCVQLQSNDEQYLQRMARTLNLDDDRVGQITVLCCRNTVDEIWVNSAFKTSDINKITWSNYG